jgi:hypothetical protein
MTQPTFNTLDECRDYLRGVVGGLCNLWLDKPEGENTMTVTQEDGTVLYPVYLRSEDGPAVRFLDTYKSAQRAYHDNRTENNVPTNWPRP